MHVFLAGNRNVMRTHRYPYITVKQLSIWHKSMSLNTAIATECTASWWKYNKFVESEVLVSSTLCSWNPFLSHSLHILNRTAACCRIIVRHFWTIRQWTGFTWLPYIADWISVWVMQRAPMRGFLKFCPPSVSKIWYIGYPMIRHNKLCVSRQANYQSQTFNSFCAHGELHRVNQPEYGRSSKIVDK